ncbi:membrane protein insertase YidC [Aggregicoccus sp. 17bor-14]|uniref:membrane protein insertase YidC n=1 Tax=Myxococcaceae TaxID=31 RepID=UPI00129CC812|nr:MULTISPECIES: membrane protein insertase YidC [Myxococcaceae]MBF5045439.1 membrane protein insertase YidC [Simulacricoccus sp. 17bor-14]MRI91179.1 membrane protein insertase YidC [Aggregicoccus sp. 17bor-14]
MNDPLNPQSNESQRRLMTALALSFAVIAAWQLFGPKPPAPTPGATSATATADAGTAAPAATAAVPAPGTGAQVAAPSADAPPVRTVERARETARYRFSSEGAGLTFAELEGPKMREQQNTSVREGFGLLFGTHKIDAPQMNLAHPVAGEPLPFSVSITGAQPFPAQTRYAVQEDAGGNGVTFVGRSGPWELTKRLTWPKEGFELSYVVTVKNVSAQPQQGELVMHHNRAIDPEFEHAPSFFGGVGNQSLPTCFVGDDAHDLHPGKEFKPADGVGKVAYFGINQQYFLSALYPTGGARDGRCVLSATADKRTVEVAFPLSVAPGQEVQLPFGAYLGPKDPDLLKAVGLGVAGAAGSVHPPLEKTINLGLWAVIANLLLIILKFFHGIAGNWGVAIILLTVLVKLVLLPLTHKSMVAMEGMKKLQPRMDEIRKKYASDRERQNLEMMKLYQEGKVNPLGGCLPMLIQMPVWIALFTALRNSFDIYWEPFVGPVWRDLTYKDPTYLLPLALGVTMIITQKLQPQMMDAAQARIMTWVVPIVFTFSLMQYPAGLSLYIFTNNLLTIVQQWGLKRWIARRAPALEPATAVSAGGKRK